MSIVQAIVLGIVQGLTEFLPVSSSAHLTLVPFAFGWREPSLAFVVAVHFGTLVAVTWIFRERIAVLVRTAIGYRSAPEPDRTLLQLVIIGTLPAAIIGMVFNHQIENAFQKPVLVALLLGVTGYVLFSAEAKAEERQETRRAEGEMETRDGVFVGIAQAISILPGISRSGATIAAGLGRGLTRETAARYSFLLSIPVIAGAVLVKIPDMLHEGLGGKNAAAFAAGILTSGITGFFAVKWFIGILTRRGLRPFGAYCFIAMIAFLIIALARG